MNIKTYNFDDNKKIFVKDGIGGYQTVDKKILSFTGENVRLCVGDGEAHLGWVIDGDEIITDFYTLDEYGNIIQIQKNTDFHVICAVRNKKCHVVKSFSVEWQEIDGEMKLVSDGEIHYIAEKNEPLHSEKIIVEKGVYKCGETGSWFVVKEMSVYNDSEHAAWYADPTIDGQETNARCYQVEISDTVLDDIMTRITEIKELAKKNNIMLWVDENSADIRAVKIPDGFEVECRDDSYMDQIPWELMPTVGTLNFVTYGDSDYQPTLVKKKIDETNQN